MKVYMAMILSLALLSTVCAQYATMPKGLDRDFTKSIGPRGLEVKFDVLSKTYRIIIAGS